LLTVPRGFFGQISIGPPTYGVNTNQCQDSPALCEYDISWQETNGHLNGISIAVATVDTDVGHVPGGPPGGPIGLTGGGIATDGQIDNCDDTQCIVTGYWQKSYLFAGTPNSSNCLGQSISALARQYGGMSRAATGLGFKSVDSLQDAISAFCGVMS